MNIVASSCWGCVTGLHFECLAPVDETEEGFVHCCCSLAQVIVDDVEEKRSVGRPMLEVSEITDIRSTGRKRAAMLYPIFENMVCEWAGLRYAGGGIEPIIGCDGNIIQPVKSGPTRATVTTVLTKASSTTAPTMFTASARPATTVGMPRTTSTTASALPPTSPTFPSKSTER